MSVLLASGVLLAATTLVGFALAQDAAEEQSADQSFAEKFWSYLQRVEYKKNYSPWPGKTEGFYEGQAPHGAKLKLYVNRPVAQNPEDPPNKSIIVKENYTKDEELAAITIMYRIEDYDPEHKDWWWVKYSPEGEVMEAKGMKLAGKVKACIGCHSSAQGGDYLFTNDE